MSKFQPTYIIGDVNSPRVKARSMTNANRSFYERARKTSMLANTEKKVFKSGVVFCQKSRLCFVRYHAGRGTSNVTTNVRGNRV